MTTSTDPQVMIEGYLEKLRAGLRGMKHDDVHEITAELRSHILDRAATSGVVTPASTAAAIASLGDPHELADLYRADSVLARAQASRSPLLVLRGLLRWTGLSFLGFWVLLGSFIGYFLAGAFALCAFLKPFHPQTAGLWRFFDGPDGYTYSLRLGFSPAPLNGAEMLGWYIIPIGLGLGCLLVVLTTWIAHRCLRLFRSSRPLPARPAGVD